MLMCLALSGCLGSLPSDQQARPFGLGTATPGVEQKGPLESTDVAVVPAATGDPAAFATTADAVAPTSAPLPEVAPTPAPAVTPTVNPALANVQLPAPADLQERWRQLQEDRTVFDSPRQYVSTGSHIVWWFDPLFGQFLPIGEVQGVFLAQATFNLRGQWVQALEMPYHVNQDYEIEVPPAILQRMRNAGVGEWAEVFVYKTRDMNQK